jgi:tRNA(Ile)-lysidine synthase TilS/MesJ
MDSLTIFPPWRGTGKRIESQIRKAMYDFQMIEEEKIAVALSGGKDSLALLIMLKAVAGRGFPPFQLAAIHVGGDFTCGAGVSEAFLQDVCDRLEIPLIIKHSHQKLETLECYSCSRERRKLLFEAAREWGSSTVAFGHHRDDNAQTVLMNLLHKAEFTGNLPKLKMIEYGVTIIRPLIFVGEHEIKEFAKQSGFLRVMCQCPVGQNSMRKQVDSLIKEMEALFPNVRENLSQAALNYGSDKAKIKS